MSKLLHRFSFTIHDKEEVKKNKREGLGRQLEQIKSSSCRLSVEQMGYKNILYSSSIHPSTLHHLSCMNIRGHRGAGAYNSYLRAKAGHTLDNPRANTATTQ